MQTKETPQRLAALQGFIVQEDYHIATCKVKGGLEGG